MVKNTNPKPVPNIYKKYLIVGILNLICLIVVVMLIGLIPEKANQVKQTRSNKLASSEANLALINKDILASKDTVEKLSMVFPDETGILEFVQKIDEFKKQGVVKQFSFASNTIEKDKTGYAGLPIIIELVGNKQQTDEVLRKIQNLPYFLRTISFEVKQLDQDNYSIRIGGFLYVNEKFN